MPKASQDGGGTQVDVPPSQLPTDEEITYRLQELLTEVDLQSTTEKMLRRRLEQEFSTDLSSKKALLRAEVEAYLSSQPAPPGSEADEEPTARSKRPRNSGAGLGCALSPAMQAFLGETSLPRPQVVKRLWAYIKEHDLQDPKDRRRILLDDALSTIFPGKSTDMFKMNKHLSRHCFVEDAPGVEASDDDDDDDAGAGSSKATPRRVRARSDPGRAATPGEKRVNGFTKPLRLSPAMAAWVGAGTASRPAIAKHMWAYVKEHGLQDPANKQFVVSDATLRALTGQDRFKAFGFSALVKQHILGYED
ncbi:Upstream activation factor subunit spp27 [Auxenochlorella protothecoides]|uniref:Upstream activation factor subunit spp27 n=2 Tax=Auxenochlorella protothecoides TaxID=3075 RepID=A0A087SQI4_AUXPR|nr:Upstream activation factor subunit spp27 [Auxenochlorella protothecoides]KFM27988.1 Upstream activation factor subunit spp27 [Auxenochlorella protothecoides]